jgi:hypothetical protein
LPAQFTVRAVVLGDFRAWKVLWDGYNALYDKVAERSGFLVYRKLL